MHAVFCDIAEQVVVAGWVRRAGQTGRVGGGRVAVDQPGLCSQGNIKQIVQAITRVIADQCIGAGRPHDKGLALEAQVEDLYN